MFEQKWRKYHNNNNVSEIFTGKETWKQKKLNTRRDERFGRDSDKAREQHTKRSHRQIQSQWNERTFFGA